MNFSYFLGNKSKALRLDEKQHGGLKQQFLAKIQKPDNLKPQTFNCKLQVSDSHEKSDAKAL